MHGTQTKRKHRKNRQRGRVHISNAKICEVNPHCSKKWYHSSHVFDIFVNAGPTRNHHTLRCVCREILSKKLQRQRRGGVTNQILNRINVPLCRSTSPRVRPTAPSWAASSCTRSPQGRRLWRRVLSTRWDSDRLSRCGNREGKKVKKFDRKSLICD